MLSQSFRSFVPAVSVFLLFIPSAPLLAQPAPGTGTEGESLTLQAALEELGRNSPVLQKAEAQTGEQKYRRTEAASAFLPTLTGSINYLTDKKYMVLDVNLGGGTSTIPQVVPTTQYTLSARWNIFDGFASTNRLRAASRGLEASQNELDWERFRQTEAATVAFYKLLAAQQIRTVVEENLKALQDHLKDTAAAQRAGLATRYDVLRSQVQLSDAETELIGAEDGIRASADHLAEILGNENEARRPTGEIPVLGATLIEKLGPATPDRRGDLQALEKRALSAHDEDRAAGAHWVPRVSLFADYQYYNNRTDGFDDREAFREGYLVGVNLNWNLFDGFGAYARSGQAEARAAQLDQTLRLGRLKARNDFEFWKRKFLYYCSVYQTKTADIARSDEALRLSRAGRKVGVRTNTDILDAQADLNRSKIARINAQIGAIESLVNLELSMGQKIHSFGN